MNIKKLAKEIISIRTYYVVITHKGELEEGKEPLYAGNLDSCEAFIRTFPIRDRNKLIHEDRSLAIITPEGRMI